jgi:hypothetical protein
MAIVFGGSIRFSTAAFRSGEYPTSSSYSAQLRNKEKVEQRTPCPTQGTISLGEPNADAGGEEVAQVTPASLRQITAQSCGPRQIGIEQITQRLSRGGPHFSSDPRLRSEAE